MRYLHLLDDDTLGHAGTTERVGLHVADGVSLVVLFARPSLVLAMVVQLTTCAKTRRLSAIKFSRKHEQIVGNKKFDQKSFPHFEAGNTEKTYPFPIVDNYWIYHTN